MNRLSSEMNSRGILDHLVCCQYLLRTNLLMIHLLLLQVESVHTGSLANWPAAEELWSSKEFAKLSQMLWSMKQLYTCLSLFLDIFSAISRSVRICCTVLLSLLNLACCLLRHHSIVSCSLSSITSWRILLRCVISAIVLSFAQFVRSPFFGMVMRMDFVHSSGHSSFCEIMLQSLCISLISVGPPALMSSAGMPSTPGLFQSYVMPVKVIFSLFF